jgi:putative DNA modification/repair radical SAM protein
MPSAMTVLEKLKILADAAKYDASCASCGSTRKSEKGMGANRISGICHSWSADGRCISLLKILYSNECIYDCTYCINRCSNQVQRASFTPDEIGQLTINFYKRNYIEGLFLSSAVTKSPDYTMVKLISAVRSVRETHHFGGYIHLKVIPGCDPLLIEEAGKWADRVSANIELPTEKSLTTLAPQKKERIILSSMEQMRIGISKSLEESKIFKHAPIFAPGGQSTQMIISATPDTDFDILSKSKMLYNKMSLKRVYYSAFIPINQDLRLPKMPLPPLQRENRLYQADWLMRIYKFRLDEISSPTKPTLPTDMDPKCAWAIENLHLFPVEINKAPYEMLIRIPGIGLISAQKMIRARRAKAIELTDLKKLGVSLKRSKYFILVNGKFPATVKINKENLLQILSTQKEPSLFDPPTNDVPTVSVMAEQVQAEQRAVLTGEF